MSKTVAVASNIVGRVVVCIMMVAIGLAGGSGQAETVPVVNFDATQRVSKRIELLVLEPAFPLLGMRNDHLSPRYSCTHRTGRTQFEMPHEPRQMLDCSHRASAMIMATIIRRFIT